MTSTNGRRRIVIMGAAGRDFHDFNTLYRDDPAIEVVAFTAAQIPGIAGRRYPPSLAGPLYPEGIPIEDEACLAEICRAHNIEQVVFAYSDVSYEHVMHLASEAIAAEADFVLPGAGATMLQAAVPVIAICAVRTGCGKSQTARHLSRHLRARGRTVAILRHPMPYGVLERQAVQRFATLDDLAAADCTVEEREEYEPHIAAGNVVFAGIDYARIAEAAATEADIILWDGGNNDLPFLRPDLMIVLVDPLRPGHEATHHPGEAALRVADAILIAKCNAAASADIARTAEGARAVNPAAPVIRGASVVTLDNPSVVAGKRVLVVEDGPTLTHGGMAYGAGYVAATEAGAVGFADPRTSEVAETARVFELYPHIGPVLPAVGYSPAQLKALEMTIDGVDADAVVIATPCDLAALIDIRKPVVRARYEYEALGEPSLTGLVDGFLARLAAGQAGS
ncbi:MAG: cyclic 2,3-diphosphoglycerate synthase [Paracoccaceae bacterium]|nr:cyclic 2,3-diphosphoglycerate synthase [Paracoccaceae bacterium]